MLQTLAGERKGFLSNRPSVLAFVGIFGGLAAFGLMGLFVGPVIMAALLAIWRDLRLRHKVPMARKWPLLRLFTKSVMN